MKEAKYKLNGKWVTREEFLRRRLGGSGAPLIVQGYTEANPGKSIGMSVHPKQIPEMNELVHRHGIKGVTFDPTKRDNCVITSRNGRRDLMKALGFVDNDGGYGDG